MKSFCSLSDNIKQTKFVLRNINVTQLDKTYILQQLQDAGTILMSHQLSEYSNGTTGDGIHKLHTTLEHVGVSRANTKPMDTIVLNDEISIKLFATPMKRTCDTRCWYCRLVVPSEWSPLALPTKYLEKQKQFQGEGVFCSLNCIMSYVHDNHHTFRYKDSGQLIHLLSRKLLGTDLPMKDIVPSPSWKLLKEYGGHLEPEDYRKCLQHIEYRSMCQTWFVHSMELFTETVVHSN